MIRLRAQVLWGGGLAGRYKTTIQDIGVNVTVKLSTDYLKEAYGRLCEARRSRKETAKGSSVSAWIFAIRDVHEPRFTLL